MRTFGRWMSLWSSLDLSRLVGPFGEVLDAGVASRKVIYAIGPTVLVIRSLRAVFP
jgi:hypothetical protein